MFRYDFKGFGGSVWSGRDEKCMIGSIYKGENEMHRNQIDSGIYIFFLMRKDTKCVNEKKTQGTDTDSLVQATFHRFGRRCMKRQGDTSA